MQDKQYALHAVSCAHERREQPSNLNNGPHGPHGSTDNVSITEVDGRVGGRLGRFGIGVWRGAGTSPRTLSASFPCSL